MQIVIPQAAMQSFANDFYFEISPVKAAVEQQNLISRAQEGLQVAEHNAVLVGQPQEITTNLQNKEVSLVLPVVADAHPQDAAARQAFLDNLVVYVEHSDGTREYAS